MRQLQVVVAWEVVLASHCITIGILMYLEFQSTEARKINRDGKILQQVNPSLFSSFVIIGDFNVNFCSTSHPLHNTLTDVLNSFNLTHVVSEHTRDKPWKCVHD